MADEESETEALIVEALIDELIERIGINEVIRLVEARKAKGKVGRPPGLKYRQPDQQLLLLAGCLLIEWERRLPQCNPPSQHALPTKVVNLCCDYETAEVFRRSIDPLIRRKLNFHISVQSRPSVVKRLLSRLPAAELFEGVCWPHKMTQ